MLLLTNVLFPCVTVVFCLEARLCEAGLLRTAKNSFSGSFSAPRRGRIMAVGPSCDEHKAGFASQLLFFLVEEGRWPTGVLLLT